MEDPASPTMYRVSGQPPFPDPEAPHQIPPDIGPRQVTLRDRQTVATILPLSSHRQIPSSLIAYLCGQFNKEIEGGDTYPMMEPFPVHDFTRYWFQNFAAIMLLGSIDSPADIAEGMDWSRECLGSFYIKPNYPGRSSHVCNAGFLVTDASRNRGVGRLMGETYIDYAPRLGYSYSVFNLVYETNVASCRIWDALGFKRIGRVKGCGNLKSHPGRLIDAIIYGRDLAPGESEELLVSEERFDKIKYYLKYGKYPDGSDRAEKSRLRSAATHYKLLDDDKLMLKDREVISDPARQLDIARAVHVQHHGGINKTTATIAEKYHWSRIKETVSDVIRGCTECKDLGKTPNPGGMKKSSSTSSSAAAAASVAPAAVMDTPTPIAASSTIVATPSATSNSAPGLNSREASLDTAAQVDPVGAATSPGPSSPAGPHPPAPADILSLQDHTHSMMHTLSQPSSASSPGGGYADPSELSSIPPSHTLHSSPPGLHHQDDHHHRHHHPGLMLHDPHHHHHHPQSQHHYPHEHHHQNHHDAYQPIDPQIINHQPGDNPFDQYHAHAADFQALLNATEGDADASAMDRDLDMLIEDQGDDDDDTGNVRGSQGRNGADVLMGDGVRDDDKNRSIYDTMNFGDAG